MTLTIKDICTRYGVNEHTVLQWIHSGELAAFTVGVAANKKKPRWRVTEDALKAFEQKRAATPPAPRTSLRRNSADVGVFYK